MSYTEVTKFNVEGVDYSDILKKLQWNRVLNGVGGFTTIISDYGAAYDDVFDVNDDASIEVQGSIVFKGKVDGPAVTVEVVDTAESRWDEYLILRGLDYGQDLLFHDDFEYFYPDTTQTLGDVLDDIFNTQLDTNITYTKPSPDTTPTVGAVEFRKGSGFLAQLQELHRRVNYIFYVDDDLNLVSHHISNITDTGIILRSEEENPESNLIDRIVYRKKRGDKLYNYIELTGKTPMYDGYTELNVTNNAATGWYSPPGQPDLLDTSTALVGNYGQVAYNNNPANIRLRHWLTAPVFNYTTFDLSNGEIGVWARYDNNAATPGTPGAGAAGSPLSLNCRLTDSAGTIADFFGSNIAGGGTGGYSLLYVDYWGYCRFPLGEAYQTGIIGVENEWTVNLAAQFDWSNVTQIEFGLPRPTLAGNQPSHLYIDGISLPFSVKGVSEDTTSQTTYRRRPLQLPTPHIRTQNTVQAYSEQMLEQHKNSTVNEFELKTIGNTGLRYAGTKFTLNIPPRVEAGEYYLTNLLHTVESRADVSGGYGWDYMTELTAVELFDAELALDRQRFDNFPVVSSYNLARSSGVGAGVR